MVGIAWRSHQHRHPEPRLGAGRCPGSRAARKRRHPDRSRPGRGGSDSYRTRTAREFVKAVPPEIIRGNASENHGRSSTAPQKLKGWTQRLIGCRRGESVGLCMPECGAVVSIAGDGIHHRARGGDPGQNGHIMMTRVRAGLHGVGPLRGLCRSRVRPAIAASGRWPFWVSPERSPSPARRAGHAPGHLLDALYRLNAEDIIQYLKIETGP